MKFAIAFLVIFAVVQGSLAGYRRPRPTPAPYRCTPASYGSWSYWSKCSQTCGYDNQVRTRRCKPGNCYGKKDCNGPSSETRPCKLPCCPVDGYWGKYGSYGPCSVTCGRGRQCRSRKCVGQYCKGKGCKGSSKDCKICNEGCCPVNGRWTKWSAYSDCSKTCGGGIRTRWRRCEGRACGGKDCKGDAEQVDKCNGDCCPVDGYFTKWTKWSSCTKRCGGGRQSRRRRCIQEQCGGKGCLGDVGEQRDCNTKCCPVDGYLTEWSKYGPCSAKCGKGTQLRDRVCVGPKCRGKSCPKGELWEKRPCNAGCCPVDGAWGRWGSYGNCIGKCDYGVQTRTRGCNYPAPSCGGKRCKGGASQSKKCYTGRRCSYYGYKG